jgi:hypothetical protein
MGEPPVNLHLDKRAAMLAANAPSDELMDTKATAKWLQVSTVWLIAARAGEYGPPFERLFGDRIAYRPKKVVPWLRQRAKEYERREAEK